MILVEIFRKRRKMEPILKKVWPHINDELVYPPSAGDDPEEKLFFFGLAAYATVFEAAEAAGMSSSAAHYLARMQLGTYKLGQPVTGRVEAIFSGAESERDQELADYVLDRMAEVIEAVEDDATSVAEQMQLLVEGYERYKSESPSGLR